MNLARFNGSLRAARINARRHEAELEAVYADFIRDAAREAARNLRAHALTAAAPPPDEGGTPDWQLPPEGILVDYGALAAPAALTKIHRQIVKDVAGRTLGTAGVAWDITHPLSQALLEAASQRTGLRLGEAVQPILRETVLGAYQRGLSVVDTAALIEENIGEATAWQARMLATTDLNSLSNGGSVMAAQIVGVQYKSWASAADDLVRPTHAEADGQVVPVDAPFSVGGEELDYPGDPSGSDEETCNCRCSVVYLDQSEAADEGETASARPRNGVHSRRMTRLAQDLASARSVTLEKAVAILAGQGKTASVLAPAAVRWVSDIAFEGTATDDGRYILPGALDWRELPLTLMGLTETGPGGHEGAFVAGRMDKISRASDDMDGEALEDGLTAIRAEGVFDVGGEFGAEVARLVEDETVRGVSVDMAVSETALRDPATGDIIELDDATEADMERAWFGELQMAVKAGTIMAATVCPTPAFANARIAVTASGQRIIRLVTTFRVLGDGMTASAAGLAPVKPPRAWFEFPEAKEPTPLTVTKEGHVYGHMALWDSCHIGYPGSCVPPPHSNSGYAYFNLGEIECDDGSRVATGALTLEALHADTNGRSYSPDPVRAHYEDTAVVAAHVRASDGKYGIWVTGALRPNLSEKHARDLMGAKPSGDWQSVRPGGPLEMLGVHAVNRPGYAVPRLAASALLPSGARVEFEFAEPDEALDRRIRVLAARAEGGIGAMAELAGV